MRALFLLAVAFLMASCGSDDSLYIELKPDKPTEQVVDIDPELLPYVEEFEYLWDIYSPGSSIKNLRAEFGKVVQDDKTPTTILGQCFMQEGKAPRILIDTERWQNMTDTRRRVLMFHELGHCVLFRDHVEGSNTSIMNPLIISDSKFENDEEELLTELFDPFKYNSWTLVYHKDHTHCNHGE